VSQEQQMLQEFLKMFNHPTLREIADMTGINASRVFRLVHGSRMRHHEFILFKNLLKKQEINKEENVLQHLLHELDHLDGKALRELWLSVKRQNERMKMLSF
jgi:hypothetical protein